MACMRIIHAYFIIYKGLARLTIYNFLDILYTINKYIYTAYLSQLGYNEPAYVNNFHSFTERASIRANIL